jgi:hypothetical protein
MFLHNNIKTCRRCGKDKPFTEYSKNSRGVFGLGAYCHPCRRQYEREYEAKKRADRPQFSPVALCPDCGKFSLAAKNKKTKRCEPCEKERRRELGRILAQKYDRLNGVEKVKGTEFKCQTCGTIFIRNCIKNINCKPCAKQKLLETARAESLRKARERGDRVMGSIQSCAHCGVSFTLTKRRAKYCEVCKVLQNKAALPFMKEWKKKYYKEYMADEEKRKKAIQTANIYQMNRRKNDPLFALIGRVRAGIRQSIRKNGYKKNTKTEKILGCTWEEFKSHIEKQFLKGMNWDNISDWHIDHIIPLSSAKTEQDIILLNNFTNLRPLFAIDNLQKGDKIEFLI